MTKDNKKSKGTKKNNKKEKNKATPPSAPANIQTFDKLSKEDQENLTKFINSLNLIGAPNTEPQTIQEVLSDINPNRDVNSLATIIIEFLKSFMLIGYTMDGERVLITYAKNQEQRDALIEQLRLVFVNLMNGEE